MPLLDHVHPPLAPERTWESSPTARATEIMARPSRGVLPAGYFAEAQVHLGDRVEVDSGTFEQAAFPAERAEDGGVAVAVERWAPPWAA